MVHITTTDLRFMWRVGLCACKQDDDDFNNISQYMTASLHCVYKGVADGSIGTSRTKSWVKMLGKSDYQLLSCQTEIGGHAVTLSRGLSLNGMESSFSSAS